MTLISERQSARLSKITNDGLTRSGTGCYINLYGNSGCQRVKQDTQTVAGTNDKYLLSVVTALQCVSQHVSYSFTFLPSAVIGVLLTVCPSRCGLISAEKQTYNSAVSTKP